MPSALVKHLDERYNFYWYAFYFVKLHVDWFQSKLEIPQRKD